MWPSLRPIPALSNTLSTEERLVAESYMRARAAATDAERRDWQRLHDLLDYVFREHLISYLTAIHPERSRDMASQGWAGLRHLPLVRMLAHALSVAFATPPQTYLYRLVDGREEKLPDDDPQVLQWRQDYRDAQLDTVLPQIDLWTQGLRQCVVSPTRIRRRIRWRVYSPLEVHVDPDPDEPEQIEHAPQVSIELRRIVDPLTVTRAHRDIRLADTQYMSWRYSEDGGEQRWSLVFHDAGGAELRVGRDPYRPLFDGDENEYGMHPLVVWRAEEPQPGRFWLPPREDWIAAQLAVSELLTDAALGIRMQTHAQPVLSGRTMNGQTPVLGPTRMIEFPEAGSTFSYVSPPVNLAELRATLEQFLRLVAVAEGLPAHTWDAGGAVRNLAAMKMLYFDLMNRQRRIRPLYMEHWRRTIAVHKAVANRWADELGRVRYDDDVHVGLILADLPWPEDAYQSAQVAAMEEARGLRSAVEDVMRRDGVPQETAERLVAERQSEAGADPGPAPARAPGPVPRPPDVRG